MSAPNPTTLSIIKSALRKLGVMGAVQSQVRAEDLDVGLDAFNEISELRNLRRRNAYFMRSQQFTFGTSKTTYSIGSSGNAPDFVVTSGERPVSILTAQLVLTGITPNVQLEVVNMTIEDYKSLSVPTLSSTFPTRLYYSATWPNGTIYPYPTSPTTVTNKLDLTWWNQFLTVALADVSTDLVLPFGYRYGLALDTAVALWPLFSKRTDLEELKRQQRVAWATITAPNVTPPFIDTTDGIQSEPTSGFNFHSRSFET